MISRDAFAQEVRELTDTAFAVTYLILGNSADSEDAMSAAILRAFENRGKLRKRESFRAWFLQILRHEAYDLLKKRRRLTPVEELPEEAAPEGDDAGRLDLRQALGELTDTQRTALLLQQEGYECLKKKAKHENPQKRALEHEKGAVHMKLLLTSRTASHAW